MAENLPLIVYGVFLLACLLVGVWIADRRATRRENYREVEQLRRARSVTSPKGR